MRRVDLVVLVLVAVVVAYVLVGRGHNVSRTAVLANPVRTPGVLNPVVTQATIGSTICVRGWASTVRPPTSYPTARKLKQMPLYGETGSPPGYQEDHLISLELGGNPTDPRNLWPEPYPRAG